MTMKTALLLIGLAATGLYLGPQFFESTDNNCLAVAKLADQAEAARPEVGPMSYAPMKFPPNHRVTRRWDDPGADQSGRQPPSALRCLRGHLLGRSDGDALT